MIVTVTQLPAQILEHYQDKAVIKEARLLCFSSVPSVYYIDLVDGQLHRWDRVAGATGWSIAGWKFVPTRRA